MPLPMPYSLQILTSMLSVVGDGSYTLCVCVSVTFTHVYDPYANRHITIPANPYNRIYSIAQVSREKDSYISGYNYT